MKSLIYSTLFLLIFIAQSLAQVPHEWYLGNGKVLEFAIDSTSTYSENSIQESFFWSAPMQFFNDDKTELIVTDSLIYKAKGNGFEKKILWPGYENNSGDFHSLDSNIVQLVYSKKNKLYYLYLLNIYNVKKILIDSFELPIYNNPFEANSFVLSKENDEKHIIISYSQAESISAQSKGRCYISLYKIKNNIVVLNKKYDVSKIFNIEYEEDLSACKFLAHSNEGSVYFEYKTVYQNQKPITKPSIAFFAKFLFNNDSLFSFKIVKKYRVAKLGFDNNGNYYRWNYPLNEMQKMVFSPNDSFIYTYYLGQKIIENNGLFSYWYNNQIIIVRFSVYNFYDRDTFTFSSDQIHYSEKGEFTIGPNGNLYIIQPGQNNNFHVLCIENPNERNSLQMQVKVKSIKVAPFEETFVVNYRIPKFNKTYKRLEFRRAKECTQQLRLFAFADPYYDSFEWHIANDTGGYDIHYGKNLAYEAPGKDQFYVIVKGIHSKTGYFAWYSDTVSFYTAPKASFTADTSRWCQYVALQMQNTSQSEITKNESSLWRIYHNDILEKTYKIKNPKITFSQTGNYDIELIYNNGYCKDSIRSSAAIEIIEAPKPGFVLKDSLLCTPDTLQLTSETEGRITQQYYLFNERDTIWQSDFSKEIVQSGKYRIQQVLEGPTGCVTTAEKSIRVIAGFTESNAPTALTTNVLDSQSTEIVWRNYANKLLYNLYKNQQFLIQTTDTFFTDKNLQTNQENYIYHIKAMDSCYHFSAFSNSVKTILLTSQNQNNEYVLLNWTAFEQWQSGVEYYNLQYTFDGDNWQNLESTSSLLATDIVNNENVDKTLYYRIIAYEKAGYLQSSVSNVVSEKLLPTLFIPNAFSPNGDGINDIFAAKGFGIDNIVFHVFSRTGQSLSVSHSLDMLWDGKTNEELMPSGAYYYLLEATTTTGVDIKTNGVFYLMK